MKECLGYYENVQGECGICPLALLCIDITIATDAHIDEMYDRQLEIEEMEADREWQAPASMQHMRM